MTFASAIFLTLTLTYIRVCHGTVATTEDRLQALEAESLRKRDVIQSLSRQMILAEFESHQRIRMEGDSGIVVVKNYGSGPYSYHHSSFTDVAPGSMHDHGASNDTVGYGPFTAVLNGVQFTTRHNDPRLYRASTSSTNWHETEMVPLPDVPGTVTDHDNIPDQIAEMQEYFRAFRDQNSTHRDYEQYFKPVLCYLEGAWLSDIVTIKEPHESYKRSFKALEWIDLAEEARLEAYLGGEITSAQQAADLPRAIIGFNETTNEPIFAQWHYRILCQPIQQQIKTEWFRMRELYEYEQKFFQSEATEVGNLLSRGAIFTLDDEETPAVRNEVLMDRVVAEIPGKDNLPGELTDSEIVLESLDINDINQPVNLGYYNRVFQYKAKDAMNKREQTRGYSDSSMYTALTTQAKVAPLPVSYRQGTYDKKNPNEPEVRASWMIPLEILFLTPLGNWNPHGIFFHTGDPFSTGKLSGKGSDKDPYNHINAYNFYQTPDTFYSKQAVPRKIFSDNFGNTRFVQDKDGVAQRVCPSGPMTVSMEIGNGVGNVRLRYPLFPIHFEGNPIWQELDAFKKATSRKVHDLNTQLDKPLTPV